MLIIEPENHRSGANRPTISVDFGDDSQVVILTIEAQAGETLDDNDLVRDLDPPEARALAAALWHHADEQDRRYR